MRRVQFTDGCTRLCRRCLKPQGEVQLTWDCKASLKSKEYKSVRKGLYRVINWIKACWWKRLGKDINRDSWTLGYKLVTPKLGALRTKSRTGTAVMEKIVSALFLINPNQAILNLGFYLSLKKSQNALSPWMKIKNYQVQTEFQARCWWKSSQHCPFLLMDKYTYMTGFRGFPCL